MRQEIRLSPVLERLSDLIGKRCELIQTDGRSLEISGDQVMPISATQFIRVSGEPLTNPERTLLHELSDLAAKSSTLRTDYILLSERLQLLEKENTELASRNRALAEVSSKDTLTGLFTRWYVLDKIEVELNRSLRHGSPMSLMMLDIDNFKQINDRFGHQSGDQVLQTVGQIMRDSCRVYDIPGRYGGEEFCLMLPETRIENSLAVAERIRLRLESTAVHFLGEAIHVTTSIGVAAIDSVPEEGLFGAASLIERADRALYRAKDGGRNRVELWNGHASRLMAAAH